ncbi:ECF transporter S component [Weissella viridescens]|uniref:ECF transporter S component n=1 Tax=Weissella viridescens TaxID=1629 RepID=UPI001D07B4E7|nr:ECF transporter S component [Weissella viridescens]MCB6839837.1 ECF transporter S component [Weissella viridescens]MCB6846569.1 ECF transporter S component [Weissella viridescens]
MHRTQRLSVIALLAALSFILMLISQFPIIPGATFLKMDFSFIPIFFGAILLDLRAGYLVLLLRSILKVLLDGAGVNDYIGLPMNIIGLGVLLLGLYWGMQAGKNWQWRALLKGGIAGTLGLTITMMLLNVVYAMPLYACFANFDIAKTIGTKVYLTYMVLPFNLIEGSILTLLSGFILMGFKNVFIRLKRQM